MTGRHSLSPECWQEWAGGGGTWEARAGSAKGPALQRPAVFLGEPQGLTGLSPDRLGPRGHGEDAAGGGRRLSRNTGRDRGVGTEAAQQAWGGFCFAEGVTGLGH